jgi:hypothetical protein
MDLNSLHGRRVQIVIESLSQDGGGYVLSWPGFQSAGVNGSTNSSESCFTSPDSFTNGSGAGGYANFGGQVAYVNHSFGSSGDSNYLRASLEMKARLEDIKLVAADPEVLLYILVDVIGTNAAREDLIVYNRMSLRATCEATYYATDAKTGAVILPARRTGNAATYQERHYLAVGDGGISRTLEAVPARPLSIAAATTRPATTQPVR